ncbi:hypothetical protein MFRU_046g00260 [Monilinia fructicola]|nr:hypothetical protein MFRU_046g00260 [Monilinia fructicola]
MLGRILYPALFPRAPPLPLPPPTPAPVTAFSVPSSIKKLTPAQIATISLTLSTISSLLLASTYLPAIETYICNTYTSSLSSLSSLTTTPESLIELCKASPLQTRISEINIGFQVLSFVPGILLAVPFGWAAGGWRGMGRRWVVGAAGVGGLGGAVWWGFVCWNAETWDIRWIYLIPLFDLVGGGQVVLKSLLYTYIGEGVGSEGLSSALYGLAALQIFTSFKVLSLARFLLRYDWGFWVICALAVGCRVIAVGVTMLLPSSKPLELGIDVSVDEQHIRIERERYRDLIENEEDNDSQEETAIVCGSPFLPSTTSFSIQSLPNAHTKLQTPLLLSVVFLVTFSLRIHLVYPQFATLSQSLPDDTSTTIYSFYLLGASILLYILPKILGYMERRRKLRILFIHAQEGDETDIEEIERMEEKEKRNDVMILKWSLIANIASLMLLALPATEGVVLRIAILACVAGCPVQVALLAYGSSLVSGTRVGDSEEVYDGCGYVSRTRSVLGELEVGAGKGERRSEMEKFYVRMGVLEQIGAFLATGIWVLGLGAFGGKGGNGGIVEVGIWDFRGWMGERGGYLLAAGLMWLSLVIVGRLERGGQRGIEEGRIVLR